MRLTDAEIAEAVRQARAAELLWDDPALGLALRAYQADQIRQMLAPEAAAEDVLAARNRCLIAEDVLQHMQKLITDARLLQKGYKP